MSSSREYIYHQPVLADESVNRLITRRDGVYVDSTLGGGGHAQRFLETLETTGCLIGLDADADAVEFASGRLKHFDNLEIRQVFYDQIDVVLHELNRLPVDGVFFDLGISSYQIDEPERGFSFQANGPLDMRFDRRQKLSAFEVINDYPEEELERLFRDYGEERHWRAIARAIGYDRAVEPLQTTSQLVKPVERVVGGRFLNKSLARVFQAIRIEVNQELPRLESALQKAFASLREGGRLVVISYHSLEDRLVKQFMRNLQNDCICPPELPVCRCDKQQELRILSRGTVAGAEEIKQNPRARSARMRVGEKLIPYRK